MVASITKVYPLNWSTNYLDSTGKVIKYPAFNSLSEVKFSPSPNQFPQHCSDRLFTPPLHYRCAALSCVGVRSLVNFMLHRKFSNQIHIGSSLEFAECSNRVFATITVPRPDIKTIWWTIDLQILRNYLHSFVHNSILPKLGFGNQ